MPSHAHEADDRTHQQQHDEPVTAVDQQEPWVAARKTIVDQHGGDREAEPAEPARHHAIDRRAPDFAEGRQTVDQLTVQQLIGPAIVIDVAAACAKNPDYLASPTDIAAWEKAHGAIPAGSIVLFRTGWSARWPDKKRYMGTDKAGDVAGLHFPGISPAAAKALLDRRIRAVGIDTASIDYGQSKDFLVHRTLYGAGVYGLENVADLEKLPATGATLIALPMKIAGGTGARANTFFYKATDATGREWTRALVDNDMSPSSCAVADMNGDGRPDLICMDGRQPNYIKWYEYPV